LGLPKKLDIAKKVIITVAPVGSWPTKDMNPNLPVTPEEIAAEVRRASDAGASVAHIHARDPDTQKPTSDPSIYKTICQAIRDSCPGIVIQISTGTGSAILNLAPEERIRSIEALRPELASLNAGSMNMNRSVFINSAETIEQYARKMVELQIKPEFEVYDLSMISNVEELIRKPNIVPDPHAYGLVMGVRGGIPATVKNLVYMVDALPDDCIWQVIATGRNQIPLGAAGVIMGGGMRVGFEDNIYLRRGVLARSNAELVETAVAVIERLGRQVADCEDARRMLHIEKTTFK
jgi:3-keto-5-aminohexanoate cleavage enzyme